jgi:hypothetical protein
MEIALLSNEKWVGGGAGIAAYCAVGKRLSILLNNLLLFILESLLLVPRTTPHY